MQLDGLLELSAKFGAPQWFCCWQVGKSIAILALKSGSPWFLSYSWSNFPSSLSGHTRFPAQLLQMSEGRVLCNSSWLNSYYAHLQIYVPFLPYGNSKVPGFSMPCLVCLTGLIVSLAISSFGESWSGIPSLPHPCNMPGAIFQEMCDSTLQMTRNTLPRPSGDPLLWFSQWDFPYGISFHQWHLPHHRVDQIISSKGEGCLYCFWDL